LWRKWKSAGDGGQPCRTPLIVSALTHVFYSHREGGRGFVFRPSADLIEREGGGLCA
jgi:hypothetical protein